MFIVMVGRNIIAHDARLTGFDNIFKALKDNVIHMDIA